jgi:acetylornithine deacetylase/succinyl-diaminopimelate desuccinylase-like protein
MNVDPFKPMHGRLYGRGAVDNKGCLAAFMLALQTSSQTRASAA